MGENKLDFKISVVEGFKFIIEDPTEHIQAFLSQGMLYESNMLKYIENKYVGGVFVDIGACMGTHSLPFSKTADRVIAFEPYFPNYKLLFLNIFINQIENIQPYNIALGNTQGIKSIYAQGNSFVNGNPTFVKNPKKDLVHPYHVPMLRLDDFNLQDITLIKIDVENYNEEVLRGMEQTLKRTHPDILIECGSKDSFETTEKVLKEMSYYSTGNVFNATPTFEFSYKPK